MVLENLSIKQRYLWLLLFGGKLERLHLENTGSIEEEGEGSVHVTSLNQIIHFFIFQTFKTIFTKQATLFRRSTGQGPWLKGTAQYS